MAGKDINIKVKAEGVDQAAQQIGGVTEAVQGLNQAQRDGFEAAQLAEEKATGLTDALDKMADASIQAGQDQGEFSDYLKQSAQDAQDFKTYLDQSKQSADDFGDSTQNAGAAAGTGFEGATQKATIFDRIINGIERSALRMVTGFLGLHAVVSLVNALIAKMERIQQAQKEITEKSLSVAEVGQTLEAATGTTGKQGDWTKQALSLQASGGLKSPDMALKLMLEAEKSFKSVGGIQNPEVAAMLQRLAPKLGASEGSDIDRIFRDEEKRQEDAWEEAEKAREKHSKRYVRGQKPDFTVSAQDFESLLSGKLGVSDEQSAAYMQTPLGRSRATTAMGDLKKADPSYIEWQLKLKAAEEEQKFRVGQGDTHALMTTDAEKGNIALDELDKEIQVAKESAGSLEELHYLQNLRARIGVAKFRNRAAGWFLGGDEKSRSEGGEIEREFQNVTINHQFITQNNPIVHPNENQRGGRALPEQVAP